MATKWDIYRNSAYIKTPTARTIYVVPPPPLFLKLKRWSIEHQNLYLKKVKPITK
ncbi:hypothetical protein PBCVFr5L_130R [Paramecium bursaria Chlorella virus Fr5L]|nr:hypothetical protein PBCVFr5L_130R [Paramecium bursaria Chlorella virus Fr5L]